MTDTQPDSTPQSAVNGSAANGTETQAAADGAGGAETPPQAGRPLPTYTRADVADALAKITDQIRAQSTDLPSAEWQKLDLPFQKTFRHLFVRNMAAVAKVVIGLLWLPLVGIGAFVGLLWSYPLAERAQAGKGTIVAVQWIGPDFHLTPTTAVLLAMAFAACSGSVVQAAAVFAIRAGNHTLERGYEAWYFLRPITSLLLGPLFGLATIGGLAAITSGSGAPAPLSLPALVTAGALAGLFTDRVLQQMQRILGATDPDQHASQQETPWTPVASTTTTTTTIDKAGAARADGPNGTPTTGTNEDQHVATQLPEQRDGDDARIDTGRTITKESIDVRVTGSATPQKKGGGKKSGRAAANSTPTPKRKAAS